MEFVRLLTWTTRLDKIQKAVEPGDLVIFHRGVFVHYTVYVGKGRAVHHHLGSTEGEVIEVTLEYLAKGDLMKVVKVTDSKFSREEIVERARSQIGPRPYSLKDRNCEHFTSWVFYNYEVSKQIAKLSESELQLLQMVRPKGRSNDEAIEKPEAAGKLTNIGQQLTNRSSDLAAESEEKSSQYSFTFIPPRPVKYKPATNRAKLAWNHTSSLVRVVLVQMTIRVASIPCRRCGKQAAGLKWMRKRLANRKKSTNS